MVSLKIGTSLLHDINLIIFDKDGTLIDLNQYWVTVTRLRAETMATYFSLGSMDILNLMSAMGVDSGTNKIKTSGPVGKKNREVVMKAAEEYLVSQGFFDPHNLCMIAFEDVDTKTLSMLDELVHLIPGTDSLLKKLHEQGCKIAIATSDRTHRAKIAMEHHHLMDYIDLIVGADLVSAPKPDPDTVFYILEKLRQDTVNTIVVGDTEVDMELGIRSGVKACVGVCSGTVPREELLIKTPYVIQNIGQIRVENQ